MTILDNNKFVSNELLPELNEIVKNYLESEYSYIENKDDLDDLDDAEVNDSLISEVKVRINKLIDSCSEDYDFSEYDINYNNEELYCMIESAFNDYKDIMYERYSEEFDKQDYFDDYYSETDY
ncbi:MAG: hypothetical protein IJH39_08240 [Clostridia bacterium]|nr:hypothetical protein [Clostridia bacterium]